MLSFSVNSFATENVEKNRLTLDEVCKITKCRKPSHVEVGVDAEKYAVVDLPKAPIVYENFVNIIPNETLFVEIEERKDGFFDLKLVEEIKNPDSTMTFKFEQDKKTNAMILVVFNPYKKDIKYSAFMHVPTENGFVYTSSCPVNAEKSVYEFWNNPIYQLGLKDFKVVASDYGRCD